MVLAPVSLWPGAILAGSAPEGGATGASESYQVNVSPAAPAGRGIGRTTGRMWIRRPVRVMAVMVLSSGDEVGCYGRLRARMPRRLRRVCSARIASAWAICSREGFMAQLSHRPGAPPIALAGVCGVRV
jgi:hypothetical protein